MDCLSDNSLNSIKLIEFGCIPVDTVSEKIVSVENTTDVSFACQIVVGTII